MARPGPVALYCTLSNPHLFSTSLSHADIIHAPLSMPFTLHLPFLPSLCCCTLGRTVLGSMRAPNLCFSLDQWSSIYDLQDGSSLQSDHIWPAA